MLQLIQDDLTTLYPACFRCTQLKTIFTIFNIHFHLLVTSFNPKTTMKKAGWDAEHTSCDRWAELTKKELHLLEHFSRHATQVDPPPLKKKRVKAPSTGASLAAAPATTMAVLRPQLTAALNGLIRKFFCIHSTPPKNTERLLFCFQRLTYPNRP